MTYVLIWKGEEIDEFDNLKEAQEMQLEYQMAYRGSVMIKKVVA
jgi:hypothetical protein|tara:strand:- start:115 stop:246 length:132 start_codon:yes stop_codon:yes gene_type:complete